MISTGSEGRPTGIASVVVVRGGSDVEVVVDVGFNKVVVDVGFNKVVETRLINGLEVVGLNDSLKSEYPVRVRVSAIPAKAITEHATASKYLLLDELRRSFRSTGRSIGWFVPLGMITVGLLISPGA